MPSGPVTRVVLEYPSPQLAQERYKVLSKLTQGTVVNRRIGLVFDARDENDAAELLSNYALGEREDSEIGWDPRYLSDASVTLEDGMASIFWGGAVGGVIAFVRSRRKRHRGYPDHAILHI